DAASNGRGDPAGRAYRVSDNPSLQGMAAASGYISVLVLALYLNSPAVVLLYARPHILWFICVIMLFWGSRILIKTSRGRMHDDPVIFAVTDRVSQLCGVLAAATVVAAAL